MALGGKDTTWKHGTNGAVSSLTDFTTKTRALSLNLNGEEVDATTFGDAFRDYEQSFKNGTFSATYKHDTTVFAQLGAIFSNGDSVDFEYSPIGTTSTNPKLTGAMVMTSFSQDASVANLLEITTTWRINGTPTFGAH